MTDPSPLARLSHADLSSPDEMARDCRAALVANHDLERAARAAVTPPPSLHFEDFPREVPKRDIAVSEAAAQLAAALYDR